MSLARGLLYLLVLLSLICVPAASVLAEYSFTGVVEELRPADNLIVFRADSRTGYSIEGETPSLFREPMDEPQLLEITPPDPAAFDILSVGDTAVVTMLGDINGSCIAIGRLRETPEGALLVTDLVGEPRSIPFDFAGDYDLSYVAIPDCTNRSGTVAPAIAVNVTLFAEGWEVYQTVLTPGETMTWNGLNDGSVFTARFISGEAKSASCRGSEGMCGPRPVSTFVIRVTPPTGLELRNAGPATPAPAGIATTPTTTPASPGLTGVTAAAALTAALLIRHRD
ncbi:MAG: hypothetical protein ACXQTG_00955 [Methanoculleaceae archaeon]